VLVCAYVCEYITLLHYCLDYNVFVVISRYDDITAVDFLAVQVGVAFSDTGMVCNCVRLLAG